MVTAEAALVLPVLICVTVGLAWLVLIAAAQVQCIDAAREAARLQARGEGAGVVAEAVSRLAPRGARWVVSGSDGLVVVSVHAEVSPVVPLVGRLPGVDLAADAAAAEEPQ
ncbi:MAG: pilus assembly protein [Nocardioidaceae bacterium]|nr:pilus assembly protein [Nocardioidaceae bacterium]